MILNLRQSHWRPYQACSINININSASIQAAAFARGLLYKASMTKLMQSNCSQLHLNLLSTGISQIHVDEIQRLGLRNRQQAYCRRIIFHCKRTPWLYARTILPTSQLTGAFRAITGLGARPLGEILFSPLGRATFKRSEFELAKLTPSHALYHEAVASPYYQRAAKPSYLWARRSVFSTRTHDVFSADPFTASRCDQLLLTEVLLPKFPFFAC